MKNNIGKIRRYVFAIWFVTLAVVIAVYVQKLTSTGRLSYPFHDVFQSIQILVGLLIPQLTTMTAFYFNLDKQAAKLEELTTDQVLFVSLLSVVYHLIFNAAVIFGIGFYGFDNSGDPKTSDLSLLAKNTAAVAGIAGLFSVLLAPAAFLFARREA